MKSVVARLTTGGLLLAALGGCSSGARSPGMQPFPSPSAGAQPGRVPRYTAADVQFMTDMIRHHAQAVLIAGWIPTHGASNALRRLGERIVVGQQDEQALMTLWLQDRNEPVPSIDSSHASMPNANHSARGHATAMPGMLTAAQLAQLNQARGQEFDRLFLKFMIVHHQGALTMVDRLLDAPGAAQDDIVFALSSDIAAEQSIEIGRMQQMLDALPPGTPTP